MILLYFIYKFIYIIVIVKYWLSFSCILLFRILLYHFCVPCLCSNFIINHQPASNHHLYMSVPDGVRVGEREWSKGLQRVSIGKWKNELNRIGLKVTVIRSWQKKIAIRLKETQWDWKDGNIEEHITEGGMITLPLSVM